jgi:DNA-binding transcriptional ArsR family regulator
MIEVGSPFGSATRTRVLLALELLGQSYPRELGRLLGTSLSVVQKALRSLERDAIVAARAIGRTRVYQLDPRYFAKNELRTFLARLLVADGDLKSRATSLRRRPRRTGKRL